MDENIKDKSMLTASQAFGDVIYTVVFDVVNEVISSVEGVDQEKVLEAASNVLSKYVDGNLKVRKKPSPKPRAPKAPASDKPVDILKAASKKMHTLSDNMVWVTHPESEDMSYTTNVKLVNGYPVRNNATQKIVSVVTNDATVPLTVGDATVALSMGLEVDYESVAQ